MRYLVSVLACIVAGVSAGFFFGGTVRYSVSYSEATYSHGYYPQEFFDAAYANVAVARVEASAALVAHHLLVKDKIADVFETVARDDIRTVVLVSPNHFSLGTGAAQVSTGTWSTPYGTVAADVDAITTLQAAVPELVHDEYAAPHEHGISALTPFVARSFPEANIVPIILDESLAPDVAWRLGEAIATMPDVMLFASVDMTHYHDADYTAENDVAVLAKLDDVAACAATRCVFDFAIDSNAALRVLFGFAGARGTTAWHLTHHGSSLAMGATSDPAENTSHILGFFTARE